VPPCGGGAAGLERWYDLAGLPPPLAVTAEGPRHRRVVPGNVGCTKLLRRNRHHLELDRHGEVIEQDGKDRDALAYRRLEIHARETDRCIAPHVAAEFVRFGELGTHGQPQPG